VKFTKVTAQRISLGQQARLTQPTITADSFAS
jgi:hypothetical protein